MKRPTNEFWKQIALLDENLGGVTYYEVLGLDTAADDEAIRSSYERQVRVVHPDRHAREIDADRRHRLTRVYARIGEAFRVLSHPQLRAEYDGGLDTGKLRHRKSRADTHRGAIADPQHPQAKSLFEKAQGLIARKEWRAARGNLQLAMQYQPESKTIGDAMAVCEAARPVTPTPPVPAPLDSEDAQLATPAPQDAAEAPEATAEADSVSVPEVISEEAPGSTSSRIHLRVPMGKSIEVSCEAWKKATNLYMQNISRGGMLLRCDEVLALGSVIELRLKAPEGVSFELPAEVVRHIAPTAEGQRPAMGVQFLLIPSALQERFESLLQSAGIRAEAETTSPSLDLVVQLSPEEEDLELTIEKAQGLIDSGAARDAIPMLQIAVRKFPDHNALRATFYLAAGLTARAMGLRDSARHNFERALRFDPDSTLVLRHLRGDDT